MRKSRHPADLDCFRDHLQAS